MTYFSFVPLCENVNQFRSQRERSNQLLGYTLGMPKIDQKLLCVTKGRLKVYSFNNTPSLVLGRTTPIKLTKPNDRIFNHCAEEIVP